MLTRDSFDKLELMLKEHEGYRDVPYKDTEGFWTCGYGHKLTKTLSHYKNYKNSDWEIVFINDIKNSENEISTSKPVAISNFFRADIKSIYNSMSQNRQIVLVNMCFNMGFKHLCGFRKMWQSLIEKNYINASLEMINSKWAKQVGNRANTLANIMKTDII